jgi:hypothetical protein
VDDNIETLELKVQMSRIRILLNIIVSPSTILWLHSTTILEFDSFRANSILGIIRKDSSRDPNDLSYILCLANQAFLYDTSYKKYLWIVAWMIAFLILIYFIFDNDQHHISNKIKVNLKVGLYNYGLWYVQGLKIIN